MEPSSTYAHTLSGVDERVSLIEKQRAVEAERERLKETATKEDIKRLEGRFNALIKAVWTVAGILATIGGSILANHI